VKLVRVQLSNCGFEVVQSVSAWLVKAEPRRAGTIHVIFQIEEELLRITQGTKFLGEDFVLRSEDILHFN